MLRRQRSTYDTSNHGSLTHTQAEQMNACSNAMLKLLAYTSTVLKTQQHQEEHIICWHTCCSDCELSDTSFVKLALAAYSMLSVIYYAYWKPQ